MIGRRVTGDREVEAKGRVEQDAQDPDDSAEEVTEETGETENRSCGASTVFQPSGTSSTRTVEMELL